MPPRFHHTTVGNYPGISNNPLTSKSLFCLPTAVREDKIRKTLESFEALEVMNTLNSNLIFVDHAVVAEFILLAK